MEPAWPNPSYPGVTYTLENDIQVGTNLYICLMEKDWLWDDLVIPSFIEDHESGDSICWNSFYISSSFTIDTRFYNNLDEETIEVDFRNMG